MGAFKTIYHSDLYRYRAHGCPIYTKCLLRFFRRAQTCNIPILKLWYRAIYHIIATRRGIEISSHCRIGKGLFLGHVSNITINERAIIGENCNIHKGVTIGQENRGKRKGMPIIGNYVWIGVNATVVGNIIIGDDVLIAPNSFVNVDIPSHSIAIGNPAVIKHRDKATEHYIDNAVE